MIALSFPNAAVIPCTVKQYHVRKLSPGIIKVIILGLKLLKQICQAVEHNKHNSITPMMGVQGRARIDTSYQKHSQ